MSLKTDLGMIEELLNSRRKTEERIKRNIEMVTRYKRNLEESMHFSDIGEIQRKLFGVRRVKQESDCY